MKSLKAKVEKKPKLGVPNRIYDVQQKAQKGKPEKIAQNVLKKIAKDLKIKPDLSQLKFHEVKESILGKHVLFQQHQEGKAISGAWIRVDIDDKGKIYNIQNDLVPEPVLQKAEKLNTKKSKAAPREITVDEAKKIALANAKFGKSPGKVAETELSWYQHDSIPTLAWKVVVVREKPIAQWKYYIDAMTKKILKKINMIKSANGEGRVFDPSPVVRLDGIKLKENSKIPDEAYIEVVLIGLRKSGMIEGPYVNTKFTTKRVKRKNLKFLFKREDRAFKEVMVYYHIDRMQRYIQELGFTNVLNKPVPVDIDGTEEDNSFYFPHSKSLQFGKGGVDDAEDAEIIIHEYGHAIQDDIVNGFGQEPEGGAMGEGFGDYLAASFFSKMKPAKLRLTFGSWDGYFTGNGSPRSVRRVDSKKKYKDKVDQVHRDGEIWSACLWEIRAAIGAWHADKLIIAHHFLLTPRANFNDAAKALITTDKKLNKGVNEKAIREIFIKRGILPKPKKKGK